jgi:WD40 repeat protein
MMAMFGLGASSSAQESDPILCINTGGHTAGVRALAFSSDSTRLYSAGMDKVVHIWSFPDLARDLPTSSTRGAFVEPWKKEMPIRWEIARGLRGSIYCLALHPKGETLALGGYGARGSVGEIIRVDPRDGSFLSPYSGHAQSVWALSFSGDGRLLASMDLAGQAMLWRQDIKAPVRLTRPDSEVCEAAVIEHLRQRPFRPIVAIGSELVALPQSIKTQRGLVSEIALFRANDGQRVQVLDWPDAGAVRAMTATADGRLLAAACDQGKLCLWDLTEKASRRRLQESVPVISLAFSPDGKTLIAGTDVRKDLSASELQVWDVGKRIQRHKYALKEAVYACAVSPDGKRLAYSGAGANDIVLRWLAQDGEALVLRGSQQVAKASFARQPAGYAFLFQPTGARGAASAKKFDPATLQPPARTTAVPAEAPSSAGDWHGELKREKNGVQVYLRKEPKALVQLDPEKQGVVQTFCWVTDPKGQVEAIAIGSDLQCGVYVYGLGEGGSTAEQSDAGKESSAKGPHPLPLSQRERGESVSLLRYYRGHHDAVTSLDVSADGKYLLSGSRDGTIRYWRLPRYGQGSATLRRWGAELGVKDGQLVVGPVDDLGPLYAKGVRPGDVVDKIAWVDKQGVCDADTPPKILAALEQLPWDAQVGIFSSRDHRQRPPFNCVGAWQQALAVYMTGNDDWIAWTPAGYYACSAGGERLIGWQINRGLGAKPSFYAAEQFSKEFHRPDAIKVLLEKGSLRDALGESKVRSVGENLPPVVRIIAPTTTRLEQQQREIKIAAEAEVPAGHKVLRMWLQVDGSALDPLSTTKDATPDEAKATKTWRVPLSPGEHKIVVWAESDQSKGQSDVVTVKCAGRTAKPCLYVLCIGASSYPGRWKLKYAHADAAQVASVFDKNSRPVFDRVETRSLLNDEVTRPKILDGLAWLKAKLAGTKNPEDVAVIFYSGHGWADDAGEFYLLPVDGVAGSSEELAKTARSAGVSAKEVKQFCQEALPCRFAIFLDACRSGAADVAGLTKMSSARDDLGRQLARSDCGVVLIASSKGSQDSREDDALKAGFFTKALVDGLRGKACFVDQDLVFMPHIYLYLAPIVSSLTEGQQDPVLNFDNPFTPQIRFPLTKRGL